MNTNTSFNINTENDETFVILLGHVRKPLFDFLSEFDAKSLQLANKEVAREVQIHRKRFNFPQAAYTEDHNGNKTIRYKGKIYDVRDDRITYCKKKNYLSPKNKIDIQLTALQFTIYGMTDYGDGEMGGPILDVDNLVDLKDIMTSYYLVQQKKKEMIELKKERKRLEEKHLKNIFKLQNTSTKPTNPWKKIIKPVAVSLS